MSFKFCSDLSLGEEDLFLIAGPCCAESREHVLQTAALLKATGKISLFRCGIWKPRSSPSSFEGCGEVALSWLQEVEESLNLKTCTEIASPAHVEAALAHGISHFWIGARTSVNPFLVQELANAVKGTDVAIFVKNPVSPDINLWVGALERFARSGISKLAAIHRGFTPIEISQYRNTPMWNIFIELKRLHPELPLICDPSHIAGKRQYIAELSQEALLFGADGLMIEVHPSPEHSLSDKEQQLTVEEYDCLTKNLKRPFVSEQDFTLERHRALIDVLDDNLLEILSKRLDVIKEIAVYKKEKNISPLQINRWNEILQKNQNKALHMGISQDFIKKIMTLLHEESLSIQKEILNKKEDK